MWQVVKENVNVHFHKISIHTHPMDGLIGNSKGERGVSKAKYFKGKYEAKLEFARGAGGGGVGNEVKPKTFLGGGYGDFLEQNNLISSSE